MRLVFFGTPHFAEIVLLRLLATGTTPVAIVANPDRPVGRKHVLTPPPTVQLIRDTKPDGSVKIFQPEILDSSLISNLSSLEPDVFVIAAYAKIIPPDILRLPRLGALGVHPSLLPTLRGASPIASAILTDVSRTGATIYLMDEKMDHGPILAKRVLEGVDLSSVDEPTLETRLAELSGELLTETLPVFFAGTLTPRPQDHEAATFTKKFTIESAHVSLVALAAAETGSDEAAALMIDRQIRAFVAEPGAWTILADGRRVKLLGAERSASALRITRVQFAGERPKAWRGRLTA